VSLGTTAAEDAQGKPERRTVARNNGMKHIYETDFAITRTELRKARMNDQSEQQTIHLVTYAPHLAHGQLIFWEVRCTTCKYAQAHQTQLEALRDAEAHSKVTDHVATEKTPTREDTSPHRDTTGA
jgi:hypothetical protein